MDVTLKSLMRVMPDLQVTGGKALVYRGGKHIEIGHMRNGSFIVTDEGAKLLNGDSALPVTDAKPARKPRRVAAPKAPVTEGEEGDNAGEGEESSEDDGIEGTEE